MTDSPKYKASLHVPVEQYGFIAIEVEGTPEELIEAYRGVSRANTGGEGLPEKEFDAFIERQISGQHNVLENYVKMSPEQQKYVQINKRAIKRANAKLFKAKEE